ncbi:MAG: hypothetical protein ACR2NX_13180 [Chthoniobacterales bacterium]
MESPASLPAALRPNSAFGICPSPPFNDSDWFRKDDDVRIAQSLRRPMTSAKRLTVDRKIRKVAGFAGLFVGMLIGWGVQRRQSTKLSTELFAEKELTASLRCDLVRAEVDVANKDATLTHYRTAVEKIEERFTDAFENLANRILEERSLKLTSENTSTLGQLLDPLGRQIADFRQRVDAAHTADTSLCARATNSLGAIERDLHASTFPRSAIQVITHARRISNAALQNPKSRYQDAANTSLKQSRKLRDWQNRRTISGDSILPKAEAWPSHKPDG